MWDGPCTKWQNTRVCYRDLPLLRISCRPSRGTCVNLQPTHIASLADMWVVVWRPVRLIVPRSLACVWVHREWRRPEPVGALFALAARPRAASLALEQSKVRDCGSVSWLSNSCSRWWAHNPAQCKVLYSEQLSANRGMLSKDVYTNIFTIT